MENIYFADIPVYRLPEEKYYDEMEKYINKVLPDKISPRIRESYHNHLWHTSCGQWRFNEIIGYVRLYFEGFTIMGELFMVGKKRIVRTRKKLILYQTHKVAPECDILHDANNHEIFNFILQYIENTKRELKPRFVDSALFESPGKFVDWQELMKGGSQ